MPVVYYGMWVEVWFGVCQSALFLCRSPLVGGKGFEVEAFTVVVVDVCGVHYSLKTSFHGFLLLVRFYLFFVPQSYAF